VTIATVDMVHR